jgi:hypothetical protein
MINAEAASDSLGRGWEAPGDQAGVILRGEVSPAGPYFVWSAAWPLGSERYEDLGV